MITLIQLLIPLLHKYLLIPNKDKTTAQNIDVNKQLRFHTTKRFNNLKCR
ncbi:hypothetical protein Hanom_Chr14g01319441 [Helianthus anomalus]